MKSKMFFLVSLLLFSLGLAAQSVRGRVVDEKGMAIADAVVVLRTMDSTLVGSILSNEAGEFLFSEAPCPYLIDVQSLSYHPYSNQSSASDLGDIRLESKGDALQEVVVTGKTKRMTLADGKFVFTPQGIKRELVVSNAFDLIAELPAVKAGDGSIELIGAAGTALVINGRQDIRSKDQLISFLKSLPVERVQKVELSYTPPASWGVGKGITAAINIVLNRSGEDYLGGQLTAGWYHLHKNTFTGNAAMMYKHGAFSLDVIYGGGLYQHRRSSNFHADHYVRGRLYEIDNKTSHYSKKASLRQSVYAGLRLELGRGHSLEGFYILKPLSRSYDHTEAQNSLLGSSTQDINSQSQSHTAGLNYQTPYGIKLGGSYYYTKEQHHFSGKLPDRDFSYSQHQSNSRYKLYFTGEHQLGGLSLGYGLDYAYTQSIGGLGAERKLQDRLTTAYLSARYSLLEGRLGLSATLSSEWHQDDGQRQHSWLPKLSISYRPADDHTLSLSYRSYNIFPSYWDKQGSIRYVDGYEVWKGNPHLKDTFYRWLTLSYVFKGQYMLNCSYIDVDNSFFTQGYMSPDRLEYIRQSEPADKRRTLDLSLSIPYRPWRFWSLVAEPKLTYSQYKTADWHGIPLDYKRLLKELRLRSYLTLLKKPKLIFTTNFFYSAGDCQGVWEIEPRWSIDLGLQSSLLGDRLQLRLSCTDIFKTAPLYFVYHIGEQYRRHTIQNDVSYIYLTATYKFNKNYKEKRTPGTDTSRMGIGL